MSRRRNHSLSLLLLAPVLIVLLGAVEAEDPFQVNYQEGVRAFLAERYGEALQRFQAAYQLRQLPRLLINIGTTHRKLGQIREALDAYESFLRLEPKPDPAVQAKLDQLLTQTRELLARAPSPGPQPVPLPPGTAAARGKHRPASRAPLDRFVPVELPEPGKVNAFVAGGGDELWVAIDQRIWHRREARWTLLYQPWQSRRFSWIGELPDGRLWIAGDEGMLLTHDGSAWHEVATGTDRSFLCVWQGPQEQIHALDRTGGVLRLEGTEWYDVDTGWAGRVRLHGCAVAPDRTVLAVGAAGTILRWDGQTLRGLSSGTAETLLGVWAGPAEALAVGLQSTLLRWDGQRWTPQPVPEPKRSLAAVLCPNPGRCWAAGGNFQLGYEDRIEVDHNPLARGQGVLLELRGGQWVDAQGSSAALLFALGTRGPTELYAVGRHGTTLQHDGQALSLLPPGKSVDLWALSGSSGHGLWAVGSRGTILHLDGQRWRWDWSRPHSPIKALARAADGSLWAAGDDGLLLQGTEQGQRFRHQDTGGTGSPHLSRLRIAPGGQVLAAGRKSNDGMVLLQEGHRWTTQQTGAIYPLIDFHVVDDQERWASEAGGACQISHGVGRTWTRLQLGQLPVRGSKRAETAACDCTLSAFWSHGSRDVWAAGCKGTLVHWDGERWVMQPPGKEWTRLHLDALWGRGPERLWAVGHSIYSPPEPPVILRHDGRGWKAFPASGHYDALEGIPGTDPPEAYVRTTDGKLGRISLP